MDLEREINSINSLSKLQLIQKLFDLKFIYKEQCCKYCGILMILKECKDSNDNYNWRCLNYGCKKYQTTCSIRNGSWMSNITICPKQILKIILYWAFGINQKDTLILVSVSKPTFRKIKKFIINSIESYFIENPIILGGPGVIVQADETMLNYKVKSHRGRGPREQVWALGIVDTSYNPARAYYKIVSDRRASTLLPIITQKVRVGSIIVTDEFKSYNALANMNDYEHRTICHKYYFVCPSTGNHTQHIESCNNKLKYFIKKSKGISSQCYESFLNEIMFLDLFKKEAYLKIIDYLKIY